MTFLLTLLDQFLDYWPIALFLTVVIIVVIIVLATSNKSKKGFFCIDGSGGACIDYDSSKNATDQKNVNDFKKYDQNMEGWKKYCSSWAKNKKDFPKGLPLSQYGRGLCKDRAKCNNFVKYKQKRCGTYGRFIRRAPEAKGPDSCKTVCQQESGCDGYVINTGYATKKYKPGNDLYCSLYENCVTDITPVRDAPKGWGDITLYACSRK